MDTYGDMVTLLLCFFVLLYSMSTISEEKWKAIVTSFNPNAIQTPTENSGNDGPLADDIQNPGSETLEYEMTQADVDDAMETLYQALKAYADQQEAGSSLSVTKGDGKVFVQFNQTAFFNGNRAELREDALPILDTVCGALNSVYTYIDEVEIMGHTAQEDPGRPNTVRTDRMLSAQRATNVLIYIQENCQLNPARLVSMGMGQWHPEGDNNTAEGRAKNRRVEMVVSGRNIEEELAKAGAVETFNTQPST